jgi:predicted polyphosphate/ATP-dependent NAD kinase
LGGGVGLKGSDGQETLRKARELGAVATSPARAVEALRELAPLKEGAEIITYPHEMGEDEAREAGFEPKVIGNIEAGKTTSEDTRRAAMEMLSLGVDLILFAGGDGTARDICEAVDGRIPALGIPAGVKIHSAVYAINPSSAGRLTVKFLTGEAEARESEVMDIDEEAFRENRLSARLYGYLKVPFEKTLVQGSKESSSAPEEFFLESIAADVVEGMEDGVLYIIGPGSTTKAITDKLGLNKTLLGVDVVQDKALVARDVNEAKLLDLVRGKRAKIVVTVIGGQGFIFGRGNQQISPSVIRAVGKENIVVVATPGKLSALGGRPLLIDTEDAGLDAQLSGYVRVINGYGRRVVYKVMSR